MFENLFTPLLIKRITFKNRLVMSPMGTNYADPHGYVTERMIDYYVERAKGGVGCIYVEHTGVMQNGKASPFMHLLSKDDYVSGLTKLISAIHKSEAVAVVQINHAGRQTTSKTTGTSIAAPSSI